MTSDHRRIAEVAGEGGSSDADPEYLAFVAGRGRLLVAERDRAVVGFGGVVAVGGVAMVTDLFVAALERGTGVGRRLLDELVSDCPRRMTCSSNHPAALCSYVRMGMEPRWRVLYLSGSATGGGAPLPAAHWTHGRAELVEYFRSSGALVTANAVVQRLDKVFAVRRLCAVDVDATEVMEQLLSSLPSGALVEACVPEHRPLATWLRSRGFVERDHDVFCATAGVELAAEISCVHPGLL